jgi:hypothetical protein
MLASVAVGTPHLDELLMCRSGLFSLLLMLRVLCVLLFICFSLFLHLQTKVLADESDCIFSSACSVLISFPPLLLVAAYLYIDLVCYFIADSGLLTAVKGYGDVKDDTLVSDCPRFCSCIYSVRKQKDAKGTGRVRIL